MTGHLDLDEFFTALALVPNLRSTPFDDVEMVETAKGYKFDGVAAPTGITADLGEFTEEYERGTFRRFLSGNKANVPLVHEHNPRDLLATTRSGRLTLEEDGRGLRARANVVKTDLSERIKSLVDSGDIAGMSIGMVVGKGNFSFELRDGRAHRTIRNLKKLLDVCTTFDPAYVSTEAQFWSASLQLADSPESLQQLLMGAYPQLGEGAEVPDGTKEQAEEAVDVPDGDTEAVDEGNETGAAEEQRVSLSVAARKRALALYELQHGGGLDDASS
jgi:HK97 family phage prohead protease